MKHLSLRSAVVLTMCLLGCGCDRASTQAVNGPEQSVVTLPTRPFVIAGRRFTLEVADDDAERAQGLMHRKSMPADHGMIFVFPDVAQRGFWMKNTYIPLDIIYLDAAGRVVSIKQMFPQELNNTPSDRPAKYAIEINQGLSSKIGLKPGDTIDIPADLTPVVK
jgi:uncharacterized protein